MTSTRRAAPLLVAVTFILGGGGCGRHVLGFLPDGGGDRGGDGGGSGDAAADQATSPPDAPDAGPVPDARAGDDATPDRTDARGETGPPKIVEVATGVVFTCVRTDTGRVRCWGSGETGELGTGWPDTIGDDELPFTSGDVPLRKPAVQLAAGERHACALLQGGAVTCWGLNNSGQLGYGRLGNVGDLAPAGGEEVQIGAGEHAVQIAAGYRHTCVVLEGGRVRCWGRNGSGQCGYSAPDIIGDDETPAAVGDVDVGGRVVQISGGHSHTCARLEGGTVRCWGYNFEGELGYGHKQPVPLPPSASPLVDVGAVVLDISAGETHTCAVVADGTVRCWGSAFLGQLGLGSTTSYSDTKPPSQAPGPVLLTGKASRVFAGAFHTCALHGLDGASWVTCWGLGGRGLLGNGMELTIGDDEGAGPGGPSGSVRVPTPSALDVGYNHSCAVATDATVWCWGRATETQMDPVAGGNGGWLGYGNTTDVLDPSVAGTRAVRVFE